MHHIRLSAARAVGWVSVALAAASGTARGQGLGIHFSVDQHSPSLGAADSWIGLPIGEGDVLGPAAPARTPAFGPLARPSMLLASGAPSGPLAHLDLALHATCMGHAAGAPCPIEVDALDFGLAQPLQVGELVRGRLYFSVDRFAHGLGSSGPLASEAPLHDLAADVLVDLGLGPLFGPLAPFSAAQPGAACAVDGDGQASASGAIALGLGLIEGPNALPGDDLDALALSHAVAAPAGWFPSDGAFLSLASSFADPLSGQPGNGSAAAHGFVGGDVLRRASPTAPLGVWASATQLGLDLVAGPDSDDLDALIVWNNSTPGFQPSQVPFDWHNGASDMLLFSVRRGSALVGQPDSIFGLPIQPGDVLTTPLAGGASPFPGILIACENLGLAALGLGRVGAPFAFGDELDALELAPSALRDCNGNGVEDAVDIASGASADINNNGVPDECEPPSWSVFCQCAAPLGPCGNHYALGGCRNSSGLGAQIAPGGSSSVTADDLVLHVLHLPPAKSGLTFVSAAMGSPTPFFDGRRCVQSPVSRFPLQTSSPAGQMTLGPGLAQFAAAHFAPSHAFLPGASLGFQTWYRDAGGPCAHGSNLSSALRVNFTP
ncbi:MAG: hypothetical protein IT454_07125 [Planctomycetes bacterium]|nr:hypothetical protein [Planctomycetota bacterium]